MRALATCITVSPASAIELKRGPSTLAVRTWKSCPRISTNCGWKRALGLVSFLPVSHAPCVADLAESGADIGVAATLAPVSQFYATIAGEPRQMRASSTDTRQLSYCGVAGI